MAPLPTALARSPVSFPAEARVVVSCGSSAGVWRRKATMNFDSGEMYFFVVALSLPEA